jgi:pilus assembly protein Flp/PilA
MFSKILKFLETTFLQSGRNEKGQGLVEYALMLLLVVIVVIVMLKGTGSQVNNAYSKINSGTVSLGN